MTEFLRLPLGALDVEVPAAVALPFDVHHPAYANFARYGVRCPDSIAGAVTKRKVEFLAGRRCAIEALRLQSCRASDLQIGPDRAPVWPRGFTGSITHAKGMAAAAVSPTRSLRGVGIDIERVPGESGLDALRTTVLVDAEHRILDDLARSMEWPVALTLLFSAKESFYKATASTAGRIFDFTAVRVTGTPREGVLDLTVVEYLANDLRSGQRMRASFTLLDPHTVLTACAW